MSRTMTKERYFELERNLELNLTPEEIQEGWIFCSCEWDGLLIHKDDQEAQCCACLRERIKESK